MRKIKLLGFGVFVIVFESLIQALLVFATVWAFPLADYTFTGSLSFFAFFTLFLYYKLILELVVFLVVSIVRSKDGRVSMKDLTYAKAASSGLLMFILTLVALESSRSGFGIFALYATSFMPSIIVSYLLASKLWIRSVKWINKS